MAIKFFTGLAFSPLSKPKDEETITLNCYKISLRGTLICSGTALVSFIFNRFLAQEGAWKALAPYVFTTSLFSCVTFAIFAACISNKITKCVRAIRSDPGYDKSFNNTMSFVAKKSAQVGIIGAAAAFAFKYVTPNSLISSLAERSFSPFLGLGTAGSVLFIFHNRQQALMGKKHD